MWGTIRKYKNGWRHRHTDSTAGWNTAAWHIDHPRVIILARKLDGVRGYYIHPYNSGVTGIDWTLQDGPYKTLMAAKLRLLMGNVQYKKSLEKQP